MFQNRANTIFTISCNKHVQLISVLNRITKELFKAADSPEKMLNLEQGKLKKCISSVGLYNSKAANISTKGYYIKQLVTYVKVQLLITIKKEKYRLY